MNRELIQQAIDALMECDRDGELIQQAIDALMECDRDKTAMLSARCKTLATLTQTAPPLPMRSGELPT